MTKLYVRKNIARSTHRFSKGGENVLGYRQRARRALEMMREEGGVCGARGIDLGEESVALCWQ